MNRREFLSFRSGSPRRVAELSCERLFMRVVDTQRVSARTDDTPGDGEPPAVFETCTADQLFADLQRDLRGVDTVRVVGVEWLGTSELRGRLDAVLGVFRAAGGRVE